VPLSPTRSYLNYSITSYDTHTTPIRHLHALCYAFTLSLSLIPAPRVFCYACSVICFCSSRFTLSLRYHEYKNHTYKGITKYTCTESAKFQNATNPELSSLNLYTWLDTSGLIAMNCPWSFNPTCLNDQELQQFD
jgi:hypothetical protein